MNQAIASTLFLLLPALSFLANYHSGCSDCFLSAFGAKTLKGIKIAKKRSLRGNAKDGESTVKRGKKRSGVMIAFSGGASSR